MSTRRSGCVLRLLEAGDVVLRHRVRVPRVTGVGVPGIPGIVLGVVGIEGRPVIVRIRSRSWRVCGVARGDGRAGVATANAIVPRVGLTRGSDARNPRVMK